MAKTVAGSFCSASCTMLWTAGLAGVFRVGSPSALDRVAIDVPPTRIV
jgi:hypothetical protein